MYLISGVCVFYLFWFWFCLNWRRTAKEKEKTCPFYPSLLVAEGMNVKRDMIEVLNLWSWVCFCTEQCAKMDPRHHI